MKCYAKVDDRGRIEMTKVANRKTPLKWPWIELPEGLNTFHVKQWRKPSEAAPWERRYELRVSMSKPVIDADDVDSADFALYFVNAEDEALFDGTLRIEAMVDDTYYELAVGQLVSITSATARAITAKMTDPRFYSSKETREVIAMEVSP